MALSFIFMFTVGLPIWAVLIRGSVFLANRIVGGDLSRDDFDDERLPAHGNAVFDPANPYSVPVTTDIAGEIRITAIPEPGFGKAVLITVLTGLGMLFAMPVTANFVAGVFGRSAGLFTVLPVWLLFQTIVYRLLLPTKFSRAVLVTVLQFVIAAASSAVIAGIVNVAARTLID
ncbi:MAG: hypothetical protein KDA89_08510 [Planctomycetaceae bacterium]|nr:hypothetical protein [Planctomycetaceae bacterium]